MTAAVSASIRSGATSLALLLLAMACSAPAGSPSSQEYRTVLLGRDDQVRVRIPAVNRGLGSTEESLNISFSQEELKEFLGVEQLPLTSEVIELLQRRNCQGDAGLAMFSIRIRGSLDHTVKNSTVRIRQTAFLRYQENPRRRFGLDYYGAITYDGGRLWTSEYFLLPDWRSREFGIEVKCLLTESEYEGGCTVDRDYNRNVVGGYSFCESLLPYWRQLDELYFDIVKRVVEEPRVTDEYRVGE